MLIGFMLYVTRYDIGRMVTSWKLSHPATEEVEKTAGTEAVGPGEDEAEGTAEGPTP